MKVSLSFILSILLHSLVSQNSQNTIAVDSVKKHTDSTIESHNLSEKNKQLLKEQATNSLEDLGKYINVIVDKSLNRDTKLNNVDLAIKLFVSDSALVETTSLSGDRKKKTLIRKYLQNLMYLQYKRVEITWADIYVSDNFKRNDEDGKWYGIATFCQRFRAKSLRNNERFVQYNIEQTTCKNIVLVVERREEGSDNFYDLKFGNIEVKEEQ